MADKLSILPSSPHSSLKKKISTIKTAPSLPYLEPLESLLLRDAHVCLLQRHRAEAVVKEEEALGKVHPQEGGHILVVGQGGRETDQSHHLLRSLNLPNGAGHNGLQHWASTVMKQVDLILGKEEGREGWAKNNNKHMKITMRRKIELRTIGQDNSAGCHI